MFLVGSLWCCSVWLAYHARVLSLSSYHSDKGSGYALGIGGAPEAIRPGKSRMRGGYGKREFFERQVFPFCQHGSQDKGKGDIRGREKM